MFKKKTNPNVAIARSMTRRGQSARSLASTLLAALAATTALTMSGAGASQIEILSSGGSDELVPPPAPGCEDVVFVTPVSFDSAGNPIGAPRFGTSPGLVTVHDVPFTAEPGIAVLAEVVTYDGYFGRSEAVGQWAQPAEQVKLQFMLDGVVVGETQLTPDLADGQRSTWIVTNLGSVVLDNGADTLRIVHSGDTSQPNSLVVAGVCGHIEPLPTPVVETTSTTTTTVAPAAVDPTVAPPTTVEPEVLPAVEVVDPGGPPPVLAATGVDGTALAAAGLILVITGLVASESARRAQHPAR